MDSQPARGRQSRQRSSVGRPLRMLFYHLYVACLLGLNVVILIPRSSTGQAGSNSSFSASWIVLHVLSLLVLVSLLGKQNSRNLAIVISIGAFVLVSASWSISPV